MDKNFKERPFKWWDVGVFTLLILVFTWVVWRAEKSGGACYKQSSAQDHINTTATPGSFSNNEVPEKNETPQGTDNASPNSEDYLCRLIAPTNLPNIYLVFMGIGGIWAAVRTLRALRDKLTSWKNL